MRSTTTVLALTCAALVLPLGSRPAAAGFGITPPEVRAYNMLPGSVQRGRIYLVRCCPTEDELGQTRFDLPDEIRSWVSVNVGKEFILPQGVQQFAVEVVVEVPEDAEPGNYSGYIRFFKCGQPPPGGGVGICLGARMTLDIRVIEDPTTSFKHNYFNFVARGCNITTRHRLENQGNQPGGPDRAVLETYDYCCPLDRYRSSAEITGLPQAAPFSEITYQLDFPSDEELGGRWARLSFFNEGDPFGYKPYFIFESRPPRNCPPELEATSFEPRGPFAAGSSPRAIAAGDLDADGFDDVVVTNLYAGTVTVLYSDGLGSLSPGGEYPAGRLPRGVTAVDLDLDGSLDLAVTSSGPFATACACYPASVVTILLNDGAGRFTVAGSYPAGADARGLTAADLDNNGAPDLAIASQGSDAVAVLLGAGDGSFAPAAMTGVGRFPTAIVAADFDRDGVTDLATANKASDDVTVLLGVGDGSFQPAAAYPAGKRARSLVVADLDRDGILDLLVAGEHDGRTSALLGLGDGTFQATHLRLLNATSAIAGADFTADQVPDLALIGGGTRGLLTAATGDGLGGFGAETGFASGPFPTAIATGDFYRDGQIDLAITNDSAGTVTLLLNNFFPLNRPPEADAGPNRIVECATPDGTPVLLDGTASSDPDQDQLTYTWTGPFGTAEGPTPQVTLDLGEHLITLAVDDGRGGSDTDEAIIHVRDTTPPAILSASATPDVLWPPNHKMKSVAVTASASDLCDAGPTCTLLQVASNEPENGLGDGDTAPDWLLTGPMAADLRAERSGTGAGRTYTLTVECADVSGNAAAADGVVRVPTSR